MRGLTPEEYAALTRLNGLPVVRGVFEAGGSLDELYMHLQTQGRVTYSLFPPEHPNLGFYSLTPLGRSAIALYPLMLALQAQP